MANSKISEMPAISAVSSDDLIAIVNNPNTTPENKKITVKNFFGNISSNTAISANFSVLGDTTLANTTISSLSVDIMSANTLVSSTDRIKITSKFTPANSSISGVEIGQIFFDNNYLYVVTGTNTIKRLALSTF